MDHHWRALRKQGLLFGYQVTPQLDSDGVSSSKRSTLADAVGPETSGVDVKAIAGCENLETRRRFIYIKRPHAPVPSKCVAMKCTDLRVRPYLFTV